MKLWIYQITRDYGFAPNPFHGYCTLATCKPKIRGKNEKISNGAQVGDWVAGLGSSAKNSKFVDRLIYAMQVTEKISFNDYWSDSRFEVKKPMLEARWMYWYGDNIYHKTSDGEWQQSISHHRRDPKHRRTSNLCRDTSSSFVLISNRFSYYGQDAPIISKEFLPYTPTGEALAWPRQGETSKFSEEFVQAFDTWMKAEGLVGQQGLPYSLVKAHVPELLNSRLS
ncbi:MAG: hypothetical protein RRB13_11425 [bacterium]|nr:hypothetical protein [bacterium]